MIINMGLILIGGMIFPLSENFEPMNAINWDIKYFLFPFLAHSIGTLVGAFSASKLSKNALHFFEFPSDEKVNKSNIQLTHWSYPANTDTFFMGCGEVASTASLSRGSDDTCSTSQETYRSPSTGRSASVNAR